ncbi:peroxiredoxin [Roseibium sp. MMSF_3544]|uniref:peroxiredoxin family protein n=1 Tax=unclassified Roseibium TaxID=2629323 RepID=UPI00273D89EE|nr:redoxin domain-containing protein [Roseibium sp. MMSF_3544]
MKGKLILPYIMLNLLSGVGSGVMFWWSNYDPIWIGAFFATFPMPFFLMVLSQTFGIARTSKRLPILQLISFAALAQVAFVMYTRGGPSTLFEYAALGITVFGVLTMQWYIWIFSDYGRKKSAAIMKGKALPELPLQRLDTSRTTTASFVGEKTLIVFFRANWCPFCMNQLKEVRAQADRLAKAGVKVKFVSNQGIENSTKLAKDLKLPDHFEIFQDQDLRAARALGIEDIGGAPSGMPGYPADTVMATVIALDANGNVLFGDETDNYRVRPHPDTFLPVFEDKNGATRFAA